MDLKRTPFIRRQEYTQQRSPTTNIAHKQQSVVVFLHYYCYPNTYKCSTFVRRSNFPLTQKGRHIYNILAISHKYTPQLSKYETTVLPTAHKNIFYIKIQPYFLGDL